MDIENENIRDADIGDRNIRPNIFSRPIEEDNRPFALFENYDFDDNNEPLLDKVINTENVQPELEEINTDMKPQELEQINVNVREDIKEEQKVEEEDEKQDVNKEILEKEQKEDEEEEEDNRNFNIFRNINKRRQKKEQMRKEQIKQEERIKRKKSIEPPLNIPYNLYNPEPQPEEQIKYNPEPQPEEQINIPEEQPEKIIEPEQPQIQYNPEEQPEPGEIPRTIQEIKDDNEKIQKEIENREKERKIKERKERREQSKQKERLMKRIRAISQERGYRDDDENLLSLSLSERIPKKEKKEEGRGRERIGEKRERPKKVIIQKSKSKVVKLVKPIIVKDPDNKLIKKKYPSLVMTEENRYGPPPESYESFSELVREGIIDKPDYLEELKKKDLKKEDFMKKKKK